MTVVVLPRIKYPGIGRRKAQVGAALKRVQGISVQEMQRCHPNAKMLVLTAFLALVFSRTLELVLATFFKVQALQKWTLF